MNDRPLAVLWAFVLLLPVSCGRPLAGCGEGMNMLEVSVHPDLRSTEPAPDRSELSARWESESCLRIEVRGLEDGQVRPWGKDFCLDFESVGPPAIYMDEWMVFDQDGKQYQVYLDEVTGNARVNSTGQSLGTEGGPDLVIEYEYRGKMAGSLTYAKESIHLSSDELVRR
jgi:hypothetical protein